MSDRIVGMGLLPSLKISLEKPSLEVSQEVKALMKKPKPKKDKPPIFWSHKERAVVGVLLFLTIILSIIFWYKGGGDTPEVKFGIPSINIGGFGLNETIILEK